MMFIEKRKPIHESTEKPKSLRFQVISILLFIMYTGCSVPYQEGVDKGGTTPEFYSFKIKLDKKALTLPQNTQAEVLIVEGGPATAVASSNEGIAMAQLSQPAKGSKVKIKSGGMGGEAIITVVNANGITDSVKVTVGKSGPSNAVATVPTGPFNMRSDTLSFPFFVHGGQAPYEVKLLPDFVPGLVIDQAQSQKGYFTIKRADNVTGGTFFLLITDNGKPDKRFIVVELDIGLSKSSLQLIRDNLCVKGADDSGGRTRRAIREYQQSVDAAPSPSGTLDSWQVKRVLELDKCPQSFQTYYELHKLKEASEVRALQEDLNTARAGTLIPLNEPLSLTGKLDKPTRDALRKLQRRYKVSPEDGIYTQDTEEACTKIANDFPESFLTETQRVNIQRRLCVDDDGIFGSRTRRSIKEYQTLLAPPSSGILTQEQAKAVLQDPECHDQFMTYYEFRQLAGTGSIKEIQEKLNKANEKGLIRLPQLLKLTDAFDEPTRDAIRAFQRKAGLPLADGLWSKATKTKLQAEIP